MLESETKSIAKVRAKFTAFYSILEGAASFAEIVGPLGKALNYRPVLLEARNQIEKQIEGFGINAPGIGAPNQEILVADDRSGAIVVNLWTIGDKQSSQRVLEIVQVPKNEEVPPVRDVISRELKLTLGAGTVKTAQKMTSLHDMKGDLSPNGKILSDPAAREQIRRLYNDPFRQHVSQLASTFGDNPIMPSLLPDLDGKGTREELVRILRDGGSATTEFAVFCPKCEKPRLTFEQRTQAEQVISDAKRRCAECGERRLHVEESYILKPELVRGTQQGLWLESLVSDSLSDYTPHVWTGQMFHTNEVDVAAAYADNIILAECKDTSFGQNDLYATAMKAQDLDADVVFLISTQEIHSNVIEAKKRLGTKKRFIVISGESSESLRTSIESHLLELGKESLEKYLGRSNQGLITTSEWFSLHDTQWQI